MPFHSQFNFSEGINWENDHKRSKKKARVQELAKEGMMLAQLR